MKVYSIRDDLAEKYGPIFLAVNDRVALRNSILLVKGSVDDYADYTLYQVGEWDESTGILRGLVAPIAVECLGDLKR